MRLPESRNTTPVRIVLNKHGSTCCNISVKGQALWRVQGVRPRSRCSTPEDALPRCDLRGCPALLDVSSLVSERRVLTCLLAGDASSGVCLGSGDHPPCGRGTFLVSSSRSRASGEKHTHKPRYWYQRVDSGTSSWMTYASSPLCLTQPLGCGTTLAEQAHTDDTNAALAAYDRNFSGGYAMPSRRNDHAQPADAISRTWKI
jgi:hypothetical protein